MRGYLSDVRNFDVIVRDPASPGLDSWGAEALAKAASGRSSIPETVDFVREAAAYWIPPLSRGMTAAGRASERRRQINLPKWARPFAKLPPDRARHEIWPLGPNYLTRLVCISYLDRIAACVLGYLTYRQQNVLLSINASETSLISACLHFAG